MIEEEVVQTIDDFKRRTQDDQSLKQLSDFYDEMKRSGIAQTRGYNLPPIDTVGTSAFRNRSQR
jgi:hypothetical protein